MGVEVVMSKFLSLAVMCSLAFPAMAFAQPGAPKAEEDATMGVEGEEEAGEPTPEAIQEMPESPKVSADDMTPAEAPDERFRRPESYPSGVP